MATEQVDKVHRIFTESGIGHTLPERGEDDHAEQVIQIGKLWDRQLVQDVLDSVQ